MHVTKYILRHINDGESKTGSVLSKKCAGWCGITVIHTDDNRTIIVISELLDNPGDPVFKHYVGAARRAHAAFAPDIPFEDITWAYHLPVPAELCSPPQFKSLKIEGDRVEAVHLEEEDLQRMLGRFAKQHTEFNEFPPLRALMGEPHIRPPLRALTCGVTLH